MSDPTLIFQRGDYTCSTHVYGPQCDRTSYGLDGGCCNIAQNAYGTSSGRGCCDGTGYYEYGICVDGLRVPGGPYDTFCNGSWSCLIGYDSLSKDFNGCPECYPDGSTEYNTQGSSCFPTKVGGKSYSGWCCDYMCYPPQVTSGYAPCCKVNDCPGYDPKRPHAQACSNHKCILNQTHGTLLEDNADWRACAASGGNNCPQNTELHLYYGGISGSIPADDVAKMTNLTVMLLYNNTIKGIVPSTFGGLKRLNKLDLHSNAFSGAVPSELGDLEELHTFHLQDNDFTGAGDGICQLLRNHSGLSCTLSPNKFWTDGSQCPMCLNSGCAPPVTCTHDGGGPTPAPTPSPTLSPTQSPTSSPTPSPTPSPTASCGTTGFCPSGSPSGHDERVCKSDTVHCCLDGPGGADWSCDPDPTVKDPTGLECCWSYAGCCSASPTPAPTPSPTTPSPTLSPTPSPTYAPTPPTPAPTYLDCACGHTLGSYCVYGNATTPWPHTGRCSKPDLNKDNPHPVCDCAKCFDEKQCPGAPTPSPIPLAPGPAGNVLTPPEVTIIAVTTPVVAMGLLALFFCIIIMLLLWRKKRTVQAPISMEGISSEEAKDILHVAKNAPRWLMPNGVDTILGFRIEKSVGDAVRRLRVDDDAPNDGHFKATRIVAAKMETVKRKTDGRLFKVVKVVKTSSGDANYIVEPLQHWQVPRPCDESLLGWSDEYCDVARALAARSYFELEQKDQNKLKEREDRLRTSSCKTFREDEIELDKESITFNDIKQLIVVPLARKLERRCCGPSSLAYSRILGDVDPSHSSDGRISSDDSEANDGKGLHSRRANIFFSWSFAQRFEDFVDAFDEYLVLPDVNIPPSSRQRMYGWVSPLSTDQLAAKQDGPEAWARKFEVLVRTIGASREKGEEGQGHGTVVVFTPVSAPLCNPANDDGAFEPEPMTRLWCVWELFVTMKTGSRLTVIIPSKRYPRPSGIYAKSDEAKCKGEEAQLIRRVVEAQATMKVDAQLDFSDIDHFVKDAFESRGAGAVRLSRTSLLEGAAQGNPLQDEELDVPLLRAVDPMDFF